MEADWVALTSNRTSLPSTVTSVGAFTSNLAWPCWMSTSLYVVLLVPDDASGSPTAATPFWRESTLVDRPPSCASIARVQIVSHKPSCMTYFCTQLHETCGVPKHCKLGHAGSVPRALQIHLSPVWRPVRERVTTSFTCRAARGRVTTQLSSVAKGHNSVTLDRCWQPPSPDGTLGNLTVKCNIDRAWAWLTIRAASGSLVTRCRPM